MATLNVLMNAFKKVLFLFIPIEFVFISDNFFHGPEMTRGLIAKAEEDNKAIKKTIAGKVSWLLSDSFK